MRSKNLKFFWINLLASIGILIFGSMAYFSVKQATTSNLSLINAANENRLFIDSILQTYSLSSERDLLLSTIRSSPLKSIKKFNIQENLALAIPSYIEHEKFEGHLHLARQMYVANARFDQYLLFFAHSSQFLETDKKRFLTNEMDSFEYLKGKQLMKNQLEILVDFNNKEYSNLHDQQLQIIDTLTHRALLYGLLCLILISIFFLSLFINNLLKIKINADTKLQEKIRENKSQFLRHMSHELRTPLNGIHGIFQVLDDSEKNNPLITAGIESSTKMTKIIENIFLIIELESNLLSPNLHYNDLRSPIFETLGKFHIKARKKGLDFKISGIEELPNNILCDLKKIQKILENLLDNAIKFTDSGHIDVSCQYRKKSLTFRIADTGIGIPNDYIEQMYEIFSQADTSNTKEYQGAGLGISICKQLVDLLEGQFIIKSSPKGTIIKVEIPIKTET